MSRCCAKQAACCHGAAILDKRRRQAVRCGIYGNAMELIPRITNRYCSPSFETATSRPPQDEERATRASRSMGSKRLTDLTKSELALANETDDILRRAHGFGGDGTGTAGAVDQDRIDMAGIGDQPFHFGGDRRQFCDAEFDQGVLEIRKLPAAEFAEHLGFGAAR